MKPFHITGDPGGRLEVKKLSDFRKGEGFVLILEVRNYQKQTITDFTGVDVSVAFAEKLEGYPEGIPNTLEKHLALGEGFVVPGNPASQTRVHFPFTPEEIKVPLIEAREYFGNGWLKIPGLPPIWQAAWSLIPEKSIEPQIVPGVVAASIGTMAIGSTFEVA